MYWDKITVYFELYTFFSFFVFKGFKCTRFTVKTLFFNFFNKVKFIKGFAVGSAFRATRPHIPVRFHVRETEGEKNAAVFQTFFGCNISDIMCSPSYNFTESKDAMKKNGSCRSNVTSRCEKKERPPSLICINTCLFLCSSSEKTVKAIEMGCEIVKNALFCTS